MLWITQAIAASILLTASLAAQTFDAASVKRSAPGNSNGSTFELLTGGSLRVRNSTLRGLIESAYDVRDFQIAGGPAWSSEDRFDVFARSQSGDQAASRADDMKATRLRLQALLADRFHLVVHREMQDMQEYVLSVEKAGVKLRDEAASATANPRSGIQSTCGHMTGTQTSIGNLAVYLSRQLRRPVVDRTALAGRYNFELNWTPDLAPCGDASEREAPSIFTALTEQLGLRLDSIKGPVETIVVDRVEKPSED
jgi:uncharacterized protein (TIGR03435 family)